MAIALALLAIVFVRISRADIMARVVYGYDVALLCLLRVIALAVALCMGVFGLEEALGFEASQWGLAAFIRSLIYGAVLALVLWLLAKGMSALTGREALGAGDIQLYFACSLFLDVVGIFAMVACSACAGLAAAAYAHFVRHDDTFAFAPCIVWSCWIVLGL